ncbi:MAG: hypothetical protein OEM67_03150 [Thermoleophilia bacterium]|nr:hypothetical protein [Thermoleophilia bacterium]MDH3724305.1 hypothetical protein [Thermoleophilia bacterium]
MIETITPAGCGGRNRYLVSLAAFALAALLAAAALGALVGAVGGLLTPSVGIVLAAALAVLGIVRELGIARISVPELGRQVPERWRRELPLPVWSAGYGAGLGLGVLTHQVVFTFWVVLAAVLAIGEPVVGAICVALFGAGRAVMVVLPTIGADAWRRRVLETMTRARRPLGWVNALTVAMVALVLVTQPALAMDGPVGAGQTDPAASGKTVARTVITNGESTVVVTAPRRKQIRFPGARHPALNSRLLAFTDGGGISVVEWASGREVFRIDGPVEKPAIAWPWIAYLRKRSGSTSLELRNIPRGTRRVIATAGSRDDLGRPAMRSDWLAWHFATGRRSLLWLTNVRRLGRRTLIASSSTGIHINPSLTRSHIAWVDQRATTSRLLVRKITGDRARSVAKVIGRDRIFWTTALTNKRAYVTRWTLRGRRARVIARNWR